MSGDTRAHVASCNAGPASHKAGFVAISVLIPVAVIIILTAGGFFIWRRHLRHVKGASLASRRSSSIDPADSAQGPSLQMTHADLIESKSLAGLPSVSSSDDYPKLAAAPREGHIGSGGTVLRRPPSWMEHVPFSDWEIDVADVVIGLRPDGRKWELGAGAFSKVRVFNRLPYSQYLVSGKGVSWCVASCFPNTW